MKWRLDRIEKKLPIRDELWFVTSESARETFSGSVIDNPTSKQIESLSGTVVHEDLPRRDTE